MNEPIPMYLKTDIYGKVLCCDPITSARYYDNVICANINNISVDVYQIGLPDAFGAEFLYRFNETSTCVEPGLISTFNSEAWQKAVLYMSLSSQNGWGHGNARCFTPKGK